MANTTNVKTFSNPFCKYKDIFGQPNTGIHRHRLFGFAIADTVMTILGALLISWFFKIQWWITIPALFILGFALHKLFCVKTAFVKMTE
jgi:hypothetical protein